MSYCKLKRTNISTCIAYGIPEWGLGERNERVANNNKESVAITSPKHKVIRG